ncbi:histidinol-phosphate transaminase [Vallitalea okinawensis]|uniref:histidinol-phosphate transaminase n=1 Tax=Vallitalea okinawensis TaxID=2078660 RepID=UPI000CFB3696|nr:histidinol-phosphate transaminase [Vallitalea okinawensis]
MKIIRDDLVGFKGYHVDDIDAIKLDANESPFPLPDEVHEKFLSWCRDHNAYNRYPDTDCNELKAELAKNYHLNVDQFIIGVGSDQIIDFTLRLCIKPGEKVMFPNPSFSMYKLSTKLNHGQPIEFALDDSFQYNANKIIEFMNKVNPKVLILCSPNNPTGTTFSEEDFITIMESVKCLVIMDEAYGEFMNFSAIRYTNKYKNLLVLRTFSKGFGLAGIRVGYGVAHEELINDIEKAKPPYNLSTLSEQLASILLRKKQFIDNNVAEIISERNQLYEKIKDIRGLKVIESKANFLFVITKDYDLHGYLKEHGLLIKTIDNIKGYYRITIGTKDENEVLLKKLMELGGGMDDTTKLCGTRNQ